MDGMDLSEDELSREEEDWQWVYSAGAEEGADAIPLAKKRKASDAFAPDACARIIGARKGNLDLRLGDAVLLKAARNEQWVALVADFHQDEMEDGKEAKFMWFTSPKEIRNKAKRRTDAMFNEIYLTAEFDDNALDTVLGKASIVSAGTLKQKYPSGKIPRGSQDNGKTFVCRRGVTARTATYTDEFIWEDVYHGVDDIEALRERVQTETQITRGQKPVAAVKSRDLDFVVVDDDDKENEPETPKKKRKLDPSTPRSSTKDQPLRKLATPTSKRIVSKKPLEFTPLGTRILDPSHTISSPYQVARTHLHVSSVPSSLPCREEEFSTVYQYLESAIIDGTGSCIYISGMPGTGKTATVREVVAQLHASVQAEELDDFIFVEINGMKVTDPHQSYSLLWEALMNERLSPTHALNLLEREFSTPSPRRVPCVVLMDELDQLVTKNQSVMYNFFNWPNLRHSRLIVLAVANTMDLPERTLSNKISSRLGLTRITFQSYTHEQLIRIIQSRLEGVPGKIVDPDAVQFASRKVAQVSGDARRALDICRRAVEIAEMEAPTETDEPSTPSKTPKGKHAGGAVRVTNAGRVTIATVQRAIREATNTPMQQYLKSLPLASKLFLGTVLARMRRAGVGECVMGDVLDEARRLGAMTPLMPVHEHLLSDRSTIATAKNEKAHVSRIRAMGDAVRELGESGVILVEARKGERTAKVRLNIGEEDIRLALQDDLDVRGLGFKS